MKQKKMGFFKRIKNAVINFDEYKNFSEEKTWTTVKYILKIAFVFSIIVSILLSYKVAQEMDKALQVYREEWPEFRFEDNTLIIDSDNKQFLKGDDNGYIGILMDSEKEQLNEISEASNYQVIIAILKDKLIVRNFQGLENTITYEQMSSKIELNTINKQQIINSMTSNEMIKVYALFIIILFIYVYIVYLLKFLMDILLLSVIGYLLSKIVGVKLEYKSIFNISAYAITLSIILYTLYLVVNLFTGFIIEYFEIAYDAIAYIYIITTMLMIKSDLMKQKVEVGKIVEEQKKIREEKQEESNKEEKKEEKPKKEKKEKKENNKEEGQPEGNGA